MNKPVRIAAPYVGLGEEEAVVEVLRSGWLSHGPKAIEFEHSLAAIVGTQHARAVNSGTSALHLALEAFDIRPGDEVLVPAFTCAAAVFPIEHIGAVPVPVDIDPHRHAIDPELVAAVVTPRTKAIIVAHLFGRAADMPAVAAAAARHGLIVIEDNALGLGAKIADRMAGSFGDASCLSFHPRKMITTGEGGMVMTNAAETADRISELRAYGASVSAWQRHLGDVSKLPRYNGPGHNFKMTDVQAAIGLVQIRKLPEILARRRDVAERYRRALLELEWLRLPTEPTGETHAFQSYVCTIVAPNATSTGREKRDRLMQHLASVGVASVQAAQAVPALDYFQRRYGWDPNAFPASLAADRLSIALPIHPGLDEQEQHRVIDAVRAFRGDA